MRILYYTIWYYTWLDNYTILIRNTCSNFDVGFWKLVTYLLCININFILICQCFFQRQKPIKEAVCTLLLTILRYNLDANQRVLLREYLIDRNYNNNISNFFFFFLDILKLFVILSKTIGLILYFYVCTL